MYLCTLNSNEMGCKALSSIEILNECLKKSKNN